LILPCRRTTATGSVYLHTKFPTCNPRCCREECRSKQGVIDVDLLSDIRRWLSPSIRRAGAVNAGAGPARAGEAGTVKILYLGAARKVRKLQLRIARASRQKRWRLVRQLQRCLTRSHYAKLLAVKKVTGNRGRRTPGVDGEIWSTPEAKLKAALRLRSTRYRASPLRRVYIPKSNGKLRPLIRGWGNYHHHVVSSVVFSKMDTWLWRALWRWAVRRHPNKRKSWVKNRYFARLGTRDWMFVDKRRAGLSGSQEYKPDMDALRLSTLPYLSSIRIRRHIQIRSDANPFDPEWDEYFGPRRIRKLGS
jgi:hypothetical protein